MPAEWTDRFALVFSNSFDHADDPKVTPLEWRRILMPGGLLILAHDFGAVEPTESDCTQLGQVEEACALFGMTLIETGQGHYPEAVLRKP
jgi:hypothetical protein